MKPVIAAADQGEWHHQPAHETVDVRFPVPILPGALTSASTAMSARAGNSAIVHTRSNYPVV